MTDERERIIRGKIRIMRTINRNPVKTFNSGWAVTITWKCNGIDADGCRQYWLEYTNEFLPTTPDCISAEAC